MSITPKERLNQLIATLPEEMSIEAMLEEITLRLKISRGLEQLTRGEEIDFEDIKQEFLGEDKALSRSL